MIGRMLASLGIGSAKVDTRLERSTYRQGDWVKGEIYVEGGKASQKIDSIYLYLILQPLFDDQQEEHILDEFLLTESFTVAAKEQKSIPFEFQLPVDTPVTSGGASVYLKTGLDVKRAIDPDDHDGIDVQMHPFVEKVINQMKQFQFHLVDVYFDQEAYHDTLPFAQRFRLQSSDRGEQLAFGFQLQGNELHVIISKPNSHVNFAKFTLTAEEYNQPEMLTKRLHEQLNHFHK
ncbi:sporulation-control protein [Seinonella peptonophila]|uniref:Sporulation-control protein n=1 Tax=Seinonella peptonophila TaxID=112248 RepID=A0A1M4ZJ38_9BACL|nr:sporulation protein [Seinonella peptonophila]SHF18090.1 sporulation-control protein [Seinonella peptonophila]